ncbi:MAG: hypothetical protein H7X80_03835 [bacterium]|nr:hypothetical protein [Candidatus Kapabacteria bacterium]
MRCIAILLLALPVAAIAQPSDAQVRKDISGAKTIDVTLSKSAGTKQWNSSVGAWEWVRGAVCTLKTDEPTVTLLVKGDAVYNLAGNIASYRKFRVISNEYIGMSTPTADVLLSLLNKNPELLFGNSAWMTMTDSVERLEVLADSTAPWIWHTLNSVEFTVATRYHVMTSYTDISNVDVNYSVRIYRDRIDAPWKTQFVSTPRERTVIGKKTFSAAEIRAMPTLGRIDAERHARR